MSQPDPNTSDHLHRDLVAEVPVDWRVTLPLLAVRPVLAMDVDGGIGPVVRVWDVSEEEA